MSDTAVVSGGRIPSATEWASRIRRILLVAHVLPAIFGLVAVTLLTRDSDVRDIDIAIWVVVVIWDLFLLGVGWRRIGAQVRLAPWVIADAVVMANLAFIGTPARTIVVYAAVEGALFAAVFVSARVAVAQVAIVYSGVAAAAIARAMGSTIPSPNTGWLLPLTVTLVGVMALYYLGVALRNLEGLSERVEEALRARSRLLARARQTDMETASTTEVIAQTAPAIAALREDTLRYRAMIADHPEAAESLMMIDNALEEMALAQDGALAEAIAHQRASDLVSVIRHGVTEAAALRIRRTPLTYDIDSALDGRPLAPEEAKVVRTIVRELVGNAVFHGAPPITVRAYRRDGIDAVEVHDAGPGYDPDTVEESIGAMTITESAISIAATLDRETDSTGHRVTLHLPPPRTLE